MKYSETNKPIVCMQTNSDCYKKTTTMTPKGILWHDTGAGNPYIHRYVQPLESDADYEEKIALLGKNKYGNDWNHKPRQAGMNCWVGRLADGSVATVQTMPWNYKPWGCGSGSRGSLNNTHLQFEICDDGMESREYFEAVYKEACEITAYLCAMYNLDPLGSFTYKGVQVPVITSHAESYDLKLGSNHGDPLKWLKKYGKSMDDVRRDVAAIMNGKEEPAKPATAPAPAPAVKTNTISIRTLSEGCEGEDVRALQILLSGRGCKTDADGIFGPKTKKAVEKYQKKVGLTVDGIAGKDTLSNLMGVA
jgi:hypothetical protein